MIIEAFKFYFKSIAASESEGLYLSNAEKEEVPESPISSLKESTSTIEE